MAAKSFLLKIVTPQQLFYSGEVEMVVVEQASGQEGYMAGHSPALKRLEKGEVKIREAEGKEPRIVQIPGGPYPRGKDHGSLYQICRLEGGGIKAEFMPVK